MIKFRLNLKLILILFTTIISAYSLAATDIFEFNNPQQEQQFHEISQQLRCPQCQNNSIADSNAQISVDMRNKVYELLQQGKDKQQIIDYMIERYGNFVSYNPPLNPATIILWSAPIILLLIGSFFLLRRKKDEDK